MVGAVFALAVPETVEQCDNLPRFYAGVELLW